MMAIFLAALVAALIQMTLHWFPWRMVLGKDLPRISAYVLGVLGFALPLSVLLWHWQSWLELLAVWAVVAASGVAVASAYGTDWMLDRVRRSYEHEELDNVTAQTDRNE
jgi:phosphate/sulfate permease